MDLQVRNIPLQHLLLLLTITPLLAVPVEFGASQLNLALAARKLAQSVVPMQPAVV